MKNSGSTLPGHDELKWLEDRDADMWMPLFAVCFVTAKSQLDQLKKASIALCRSKADTDEDKSLSLRLLADIREVWPAGAPHCETNVLIPKLLKLEESPWNIKNKELDPRKLARLLKPYGVKPGLYREGERGGLRGYSRVALDLAFARYLRPSSATSATSLKNNDLEANLSATT